MPWYAWLIGTFEAAVCFWFTLWLTHPDHRAERLALFTRQRTKVTVPQEDWVARLARNGTVTKDADYGRILDLQSELKRTYEAIAQYKRSEKEYENKIIDSWYGSQVSNNSRPDVNHIATPAYEARIQRRADARRKRRGLAPDEIGIGRRREYLAEKYQMGNWSEEWRNML